MAKKVITEKQTVQDKPLSKNELQDKIIELNAKMNELAVDESKVAEFYEIKAQRNDLLAQLAQL